MDRGANVKQAVPFFWVSSIEESLGFYVDGLGFQMTKQWVDDGKLRWCWLQLGGAAVMLQQFWKEGHHAGRPEGKLGQGVSVCFICEDALAIYREVLRRGTRPRQPFVGNSMWVTEVTDPDGYSLMFESPTEVPEGTLYVE